MQLRIAKFTLNEAKIKVIVDFVRTKASQDILHEKSSSSSQLNDSKFFIDSIGKGINNVDRRCLHEDSQPCGDHLTKNRWYLWWCGEISFLGKYIFSAVVAHLFIS